MDMENANPIVHDAVGSKRDASLFDVVPSKPSPPPVAVVSRRDGTPMSRCRTSRLRTPTTPSWTTHGTSDDEHHDVKTRQVLRRLQVGQYVSYFAKGVYRCPFCTRRLGTTSTASSRMPRTSATPSPRSATVNPYSFRSSTALGMHLRIQRVDISPGACLRSSPRLPRGARSGSRGRWGRRSPGRVLLLQSSFYFVVS
ncbi:hypothetical protein QYE76_067561 [Lolium multiflorum]|uniref:Uncharacterized protein n=1 Tax=Lolium multiflorum TaxID=4521 RepID=A0AAD8WAU9_LOLMU|nr:hypothetical protein QYE76_067561 [Lolium multiflorum]